MNRKAQIGYYLAFVILAIIIITITAILAPMGSLFNTEMYIAGEGILANANQSINNIQDAEIREAIRGSTESAMAATQNNIEVNNNLFQYGWVLVVIIAALMLFLTTRRSVEYGSGFI